MACVPDVASQHLRVIKELCVSEVRGKKNESLSLHCKGVIDLSGAAHLLQSCSYLGLGTRP
jgi:hypothetical protein